MWEETIKERCRMQGRGALKTTENGYGWFTAVFDRNPEPNLLKNDEYVIQLISPRAIAHPCQIIWGLYHALREIERGRARARDPGLESLLWITGSWQIREALQKGGLREGEREAFVLFFRRGLRKRDVGVEGGCPSSKPPEVVLKSVQRAGGRVEEVPPGGVEAFFNLTGKRVEEDDLLKEILNWITIKGGRAL